MHENQSTSLTHKIFKAVFSPAFLRFLVVGSIGTVLDYGTYFFFSRSLGTFELYASLAGSAIGFTNNFLFHRYWTFGEQTRGGHAGKQLFKYTVVSLSGIMIGNMLFFALFHWLGVYDVFARIVMTVLITFWNFFGNMFWSFKIKKSPQRPSVKSANGNDGPVLSVVIPAFNEERRIGRTLIEVINFLAKQRFSSEVIVVDDGSKDQTDAVVNKISSGKIPLRLIKLEENRGKGEAVKTGVMAARGINILFADADNSTPIAEVNKLLLYISEAPIVIGSRYLDSSSVEVRQPAYRIFLSRLGNFVVRAILTPGIKDTQCGFKLFTKETAQMLFPLLTLSRWGFDFELLSLAKKFGIPVKEVSVAWYNSEGTRLRPIRAYPKTFLEVLKVKFNHLTGKYNNKHQ